MILCQTDEARTAIEGKKAKLEEVLTMYAKEVQSKKKTSKKKKPKKTLPRF